MHGSAADVPGDAESLRMAANRDAPQIGIEIAIPLNDSGAGHDHGHGDGGGDNDDHGPGLATGHSHDAFTHAAQIQSLGASRRPRSGGDSGANDVSDDDLLEAAWPPKTRQEWREIAMRQERLLEEDEHEKAEHEQRQRQLLAGLASASTQAPVNDLDAGGTSQADPNININTNTSSHKLSRERLAMFGGGGANANAIANANAEANGAAPGIPSLGGSPSLSQASATKKRLAQVQAQSPRPDPAASSKTNRHQHQHQHQHQHPALADAAVKLPNGFHKRQNMRNASTTPNNSMPKQPKRSQSNAEQFTAAVLEAGVAFGIPADVADTTTTANTSVAKFPMPQVCFRTLSKKQRRHPSDAADADADSGSCSLPIFSESEVSSLGEDHSLNSASFFFQHAATAVAPLNTATIGSGRNGHHINGNGNGNGNNSAKKNQPPKQPRRRTNYRFRYEGPTVLTSSSDEDGGFFFSSPSTTPSKSHGNGSASGHDERFIAGGAQEKVPPCPVQRRRHAHDAAPGVPGRRSTRHFNGSGTASSDDASQSTSASIDSGMHTATSQGSFLRRPDIWVTPIQSHQHQQQRNSNSNSNSNNSKRSRNGDSRSGLRSVGALQKSSQKQRLHGDGYDDDDEDAQIDSTYDRFSSATATSRRRSQVTSTESFGTASSTNNTDAHDRFASSVSAAKGDSRRRSISQHANGDSSFYTNTSANTNKNFHDSCKSPPQLPQLRQPPKRRWRIKRVWNVQELDDMEEEHIADNPVELYENLRHLFGVPEGGEVGDEGNDHGADNGKTNDNANNRDATATAPAAASGAQDGASTASAKTSKPWKVLKLLDINGELLDHPNEGERVMDEEELLQHLKNMAIEDLLYIDSIQDLSTATIAIDSKNGKSSSSSSLQYSEHPQSGDDNKRNKTEKIPKSAASASSTNQVKDKASIFERENSKNMTQNGKTANSNSGRSFSNKKGFDFKQGGDEPGTPGFNKHKKRAYHRPDNWVSPDERPIIGKRSWRVKKQDSDNHIGDDDRHDDDDDDDDHDGHSSNDYHDGSGDVGIVQFEKDKPDQGVTNTSNEIPRHKSITTTTTTETTTPTRTEGKPRSFVTKKKTLRTPVSPEKHKQRAFHRPDNWVSPDGKPNMGRRSWKVKKVIDLESDKSSQDENGKEDDHDHDNRNRNDGEDDTTGEYMLEMGSSRSIGSSAVGSRRSRNRTHERKVDDESLTMEKSDSSMSTSNIQDSPRRFRKEKITPYDSPTMSAKRAENESSISQMNASGYGKSPFPVSPITTPWKKQGKNVLEDSSCPPAPYLSPLDDSSNKLVLDSSLVGMMASKVSSENFQNSSGQLSAKSSSSQSTCKKAFTPLQKHKKGMPKPKVAIKMWWE